MSSDKVKEYLALRTRGSNIPELPITRLKLNGNTGDFLINIPDPENEGKWKNVPMANPDGTPVLDSFGGVILKVMYFAEKKTKWEDQGNGKRICTSKIKRVTREFENFRDEKIELLDISEGYPGKHFKTYASYPEFKEATTLREEGEDEGTWGYTLKAQLYILQISTGTLLKMTVSGKSLSELFTYGSRKPVKDSLTIPWLVKFSEAVDISQIKTIITKRKHARKISETAEAESYYASFTPAAICSDEEMEIVVEHAMKLQEYQDAWKAVRKETPIEKVETVEAMPVIDALGDMGMIAPQGDDTPMEDIPF